MRTMAAVGLAASETGPEADAQLKNFEMWAKENGAPAVQAWLAKHPRFVCHFIPTSSSWLNMVERWFRELTDQAIRRGVFLSVPDLVKAIQDYLARWNEAPRPFIWTASVEVIMKKIDRARKKLEAIKPGCTQPRQKGSQN